MQRHGAGQGERIERVNPEQARREVAAGRALLVCAYDDESKCARMRLEGAITVRELQQRAPSLPKDQPIVFYCA